MHQVIGNIHIHSTYSDGHSSIQDIARAAKNAGLSFVVITDHNTLRGLPQEGFIDGVFVLVGSEINTDHHHYLALGISEDVPPNDNDPQQVISAVTAQDGLGFIAHPYEKGSPLMLQGKTYPWSNWETNGFTGIEVWNWCSQWRDGAQNVFLGLYYAYLNPYGPITGPCPQALARFDALAQTRPLVAIAGSDAHAWPVRWGPVRRTIFPYEFLFRTANNCLLLDGPLSPNPTEAKKQLLGALRSGRSVIVNSRVGNPDGFAFTAISDNKEYHIGDTVPYTDSTNLKITCPNKYRGCLTHRIIRNGQLYNHIPRCNVTVRIHEPGVYRLEVYANKKPWIFTNPIYIQS